MGSGAAVEGAPTSSASVRPGRGSIVAGGATAVGDAAPARRSSEKNLNSWIGGSPPAWATVAWAAGGPAEPPRPIQTPEKKATSMAVSSTTNAPSTCRLVRAIS